MIWKVCSWVQHVLLCILLNLVINIVEIHATVFNCYYVTHCTLQSGEVSFSAKVVLRTLSCLFRCFHVLRFENNVMLLLILLLPSFYSVPSALYLFILESP